MGGDCWDSTSGHPEKGNEEQWVVSGVQAVAVATSWLWGLSPLDALLKTDTT